MAGCATAEAVYVFADGGGIGRFDGERWALVDPALRSISSAVCTRDRAVAVGAAGRVVTVSDRELSVRIDTVQIDDLFGVSALPDGVLVVGARGTVLRQASAWQPYARGIAEDLYGVAAFSGNSAWAVGAGGVTYRLDDAGWKPIPSGVTTALRTVSGTTAASVVAAGDGGVALSWTGAEWRRIDLGTTATLRSSAFLGRTVVFVGDGGTAVQISETGTFRIDLATTCTLRAVFVRGSEQWFVGSDGTRAGVWRRAGDRLDRWGTC